MPVMPRTNEKCQKIADNILGKKKKRPSSVKGIEKKDEKDRRLTFEETSKVK